METVTSVKTGYDLWAHSYDSECNVLIRLEANHSYIRQNVIRKSTLQKRWALDIGCGSGRHIPGLEVDFKNVVGIDLSEKMLAVAKSKCSKPSTEFICGDFIRHSFGEQKFDFINCSLALMHISELEDFFRKVSEVLAPGGICYLVDATEDLLKRGSSPNFEVDGQNILVAHEIHSFSKIRELMSNHQLTIKDNGFIPFDPYIINADRKLIRYLNQDCLYFVAAAKEETA